MQKQWILLLVASILVAGVLTMGFWDKLFGKKKGNGGSELQGQSASFPWDQHPSIYEYVKAHTTPDKKGLSGTAESLPDDEKHAKGSKIRWVAGGIDGVLAGGKNESEVAELHRLLQQYGAAPSSENKLKVYEFSVEHRTIGLIDPLLDSLREERGIPVARLYDLVHSFATQAVDREPVKLGIAILGIFRGGQDKDVFLTLGRHDEFTLYCTIALINTLDGAEDEIWQLAQQVHGWGRIQIIWRLAKQTKNPRIQDWLLREGYKNSVMTEYTAYACAMGGGLKAVIEKTDMDDALLNSAGEIIAALIAGTPGKPLDDYDDGAAVVTDYLKHIRRRASTLRQFLTVDGIKGWLSAEKADWAARAAKGWTAEKRTDLLGQCREIMERPTWREQVVTGLKSEDPQVFSDASQAADVLGIETWPVHWDRLCNRPLDYSRWFYVMAKCNADRIADVVAFAEKSIPLDKLSTGPALEVGLGKGFEDHSCLGCVLQDLGKYPGHGADLIKAGLHSPVIRNRNMALNALSGWGKAKWPTGMEQVLAEALSKEPDDKVRERMQRATEGKPLDPPTTQPSDSPTSQPSAVVAASEPAANRRVAEVKVTRDGKVFLDEKPVSIDQLRAAFAKLKKDGDEVWYHREDPQGDGPPEALAVMQAVVEAGLPIKLSSKPDFSDSVGPDGGSH